MSKLLGVKIKKDEEGLELESLIAIGARVMLTSNIWTDAGLVNGALGVIQQIMYNFGNLPPKPLTYVLVRFDNFLGFHGMNLSLKLVLLHPLKDVLGNNFC